MNIQVIGECFHLWLSRLGVFLFLFFFISFYLTIMSFNNRHSPEIVVRVAVDGGCADVSDLLR